MGRAEQSSHDTPGENESFRSHLLQLDHWTFLVALALVVANVWIVSPYLSAGAAVLLLVALCYDAYEFYRS
jgi:hypothetical protein